MGLELSDKLDSLNVIHETIEFIEKIIDDDDERADILDTLMGYKNALLSERKISMDDSDRSHPGSMVVVNVELLKQLIAKVNQVGNDWDAFAERVDKVQFDDSEVKPFRPLNENFASWYKLIDLEASSNQMESTPRMVSVGIDVSVQTDQDDATANAEAIIQIVRVLTAISWCNQRSLRNDVDLRLLEWLNQIVIKTISCLGTMPLPWELSTQVLEPALIWQLQNRLRFPYPLQFNKV